MAKFLKMAKLCQMIETFKLAGCVVWKKCSNGTSVKIDLSDQSSLSEQNLPSGQSAQIV